ncbi:MAG: hypothetical protein E7171_04425 [Firmicutes bacterium]|nr:hypothetical protein [Bacillota bacterium]
MYFIVKRYVDNMSIHDLNNMAISKGIGLSKVELEFSYEFIKKNWMNVLSNKGLFDIDKYKSKYSEENFNKIKSLYKELLLKYGMYL